MKSVKWNCVIHSRACILTSSRIGRLHHLRLQHLRQQQPSHHFSPINWLFWSEQREIVLSGSSCQLLSRPIMQSALQTLIVGLFLRRSSTGQTLIISCPSMADAVSKVCLLLYLFRYMAPSPLNTQQCCRYSAGKTNTHLQRREVTSYRTLNCLFSEDWY